MKTATHGLPRVDRDLTVQPQTRLRERDTENCILTFHSPFLRPLTLHRLAHAHRACPLSVDLSPCMQARYAKRSRGFDQRSVGISDRSVVRSEIVDADRAESSERS